MRVSCEGVDQQRELCTKNVQMEGEATVEGENLHSFNLLKEASELLVQCPFSSEKDSIVALHDGIHSGTCVPHHKDLHETYLLSWE